MLKSDYPKCFFPDCREKALGFCLECKQRFCIEPLDHLNYHALIEHAGLTVERAREWLSEDNNCGCGTCFHSNAKRCEALKCPCCNPAWFEGDFNCSYGVCD